MTEKKEYYIPNIEDIHIGYECEFHGMTTGGIYFFNEDGTKNEKTSIEPHIQIWYPITCGLEIWSNDRTPEDIFKLIKNNQIRTPYLTREQIKNEGWVIISKKSDNNYTYGNKGYLGTELRYDSGYCTLAIYNTILGGGKDVTYPAFYGECKSINEFRKIIKMINI